jgi:hypothetical protein
VVLDVTAKTETGAKVYSYQKVWREIGIDLAGNEQVKSWEIKNTLDLALQPRQTHSERLTIALPDGTRAVDIEAVLTYQHRPGEEFIVHRAARKVALPRP